MASPADPETMSCTPADAKEPLNVAAMTPPPAALPPVAGAGDLELRLLQAAGEYAAHGLARSYKYVKHSSRALGFVASSTEIVVTKAGLVALVKFFYEQYLRLGHPIVRSVDDAVGRCVVGAFVRVLLAVEYQQPEGSLGLLTASGEPLQLTYYERLQALLYGQVPRLQGLIMEIYACAEKARNAPSPVTFDPEDYVLKDEIARLQQETAEKMHEQEHKLAAMKEQLETAEGLRQRLENEMKSAAAAEMAERQRLLEEKELTIAALNEQILAAELAREQLTQELQTSQEGRESERDRDSAVAEMEAQVANLQRLVEDAERGREQLRANLREALDLKEEESREALSVKDQEVETLKTEIQAAEMARKKLEDDLKGKVEAAERARKLIEQELKKELQAAEQARAQLERKRQDEAQAAEMARKKLEDDRKIELEAAQLAREKAEEQLKREVEAAEAARETVERELKLKVEAAELARKQAEQELEATRTRMESEHANRLKELEDELARAKLAASDKADSLRQQRTSFNANLVKDYVQHAKGDEPRKPRAASVSDNQREDEELTMSARSSSTSSATSPRSEELKKAKAEKEKLNARMRRVLGSRF